MPQKGTTLRGRGYGLCVTGYGLRVMGRCTNGCTMLLQSPYNPPTMVRLNSAQRNECINWRANAKAKAELQNRIKTITRNMKTDLKNWKETHPESEPDTLELVVKCID